MGIRLPTRTSLVRWLLVLIASWGILSTSFVAVLILSHDPEPDHRAIIKMAIGLILDLVCAGRGRFVLAQRLVRGLGEAASPWAGRPGSCSFASSLRCWRKPSPRA